MNDERQPWRQTSTNDKVTDIIQQLEFAEAALRASLAAHPETLTDLAPLSPALLREAREALEEAQRAAVTEPYRLTEPTSQHIKTHEQFHRAVLDSLTSSIAVLDQAGDNTAINDT